MKPSGMSDAQYLGMRKSYLATLIREQIKPTREYRNKIHAIIYMNLEQVETNIKYYKGLQDEKSEQTES